MQNSKLADGQMAIPAYRPIRSRSTSEPLFHAARQDNTPRGTAPAPSPTDTIVGDQSQTPWGKRGLNDALFETPCPPAFLTRNFPEEEERSLSSSTSQTTTTSSEDDT